MRLRNLCVMLWALPAAILGNTYHVPHDYPLLQSATDASGSNDTIICDTVKDFDTIKIVNKVNLFIKGPSQNNLTNISKVLLIDNSNCVLEMLSFLGTKGFDGVNNNSCKSVPALDGKPGEDAIITDSSSVAISGCTVKGGDGGTYGISYQSGMLCFCGSKGAPGTALRANNSTITLKNDSLVSGYCAGTSIAGCFTNSCTVQGFGCVALNGSIIDTINSKINSINLDSTSIMEQMTKIVKGRYLNSPAAMRLGDFVSVTGIIKIPDGFKTPYSIRVYNAQGTLVLSSNSIVTNHFNPGNKLAQGAYILSLQSAEGSTMGRFIHSK